MEDDRFSPDFGFGAALPSAPTLVSLTPVSSSSRRLSSHFCEPKRPISASRRLSWVSLEGRLVGASEATSAKTIGGNLSSEEVAAWELFTPMQRVLIVAVVAVAVADMKKFRQIRKLQQSVQIRDEILASMQQKLDNLCDQMNSMKVRPEMGLFPMLISENGKSSKHKLCSCGDQNLELSRSSVEWKRESIDRDEMLKMGYSNLNEAEQEERRMSDLSDWCSSITSSAEIQLNNVAVDQDIYNLQKACEEKDATIKELTAVVKASDIAGSKRITELEDIIKRKNSIITKMKKDMMVLEQKVLHFTRLNRPSFSTSNSNSKKLPAMSPNLLYDMDSSTSPSSSDSDSPVGNGKGQQQSKTLLVGQDQKIRGSNYAHSILHQGVIAEASQRSSRPEKENLVQRLVSPLKEKSMNQGADSGVGQDQKIRGSNYAHSILHQGEIAEASQRSSRPEKENLEQRPVSQGADSGVPLKHKQLVSSSGDSKRYRRRYVPGLKNTASGKRRWV